VWQHAAELALLVLARIKTTRDEEKKKSRRKDKDNTVCC